MKCIKCGSENVNVQLVNETKKRGFFGALLNLVIKIILLCVSFILWLISLILPIKRKTKTNKYAVCQNCGYSWKIK